MIKLVNFLVKILASCIVGLLAWFNIALSLIMWNKKFMDITIDTLKLIWDKPKI